VLLRQVVDTSRRVAETSKRREKIDAIAELLRQTAPDEIPIVVPYLSGATRQGRIGIGYATIREAVGAPAEQSTLEVADVDRMLDAYGQVQGAGSAGRRREVLRSVFARATEPEQQFLTGLLMGELRQGALEGIMVDAVAKASGIAPARVRHAVMMAGEVAAVARAAMERGEAGLTQYDLQLFRPVQPMLAQSAEDVAEALEELGEAAFEYKFDGARVQVHRSGDDVRVYSRRLNEVTAAVPEIVEAVRALPARELILDGEVLSFDTAGRPQPFQITMRRFGRRLNVDELRTELPLTPVWFDLLYADGGSLTGEAQSRRFDELTRLVPAEALVPNLTTADAERAEAFAKEAIARGHEGIMAKARDAVYAAGARGQSWLKIKKPRTLDLVILAAEWGNGRRKGWLSNLHLGARDTVEGGFAMLGKTFKGLTDEMLEWQTRELLKLEVARDSYTIHVEPKLVVEIAFNEIQISPRYASGLALRFARVKRYRPDKSADQADTFATVQALAGTLVTPPDESAR
jgi:DNA ligase-1